MATKKTFAFALAQPVKAQLSNELGVVIGRAHYLRANPTYFVEYLAADGRQAQAWFDEEALAALTSDELAALTSDEVETKGDGPGPGDAA